MTPPRPEGVSLESDLDGLHAWGPPDLTPRQKRWRELLLASAAILLAVTLVLAVLLASVAPWFALTGLLPGLLIGALSVMLVSLVFFKVVPRMTGWLGGLNHTLRLTWWTLEVTPTHIVIDGMPILFSDIAGLDIERRALVLLGDDRVPLATNGTQPAQAWVTVLVQQALIQRADTGGQVDVPAALQALQEQRSP